MELILNDDTIKLILIIFSLIMATVTAKYGYYYRKFKLAITETRILLDIIDDILSDDKITPEELKTKLLPAFKRLRKLHG